MLKTEAEDKQTKQTFNQTTVTSFEQLKLLKFGFEEKVPLIKKIAWP